MAIGQSIEKPPREISRPVPPKGQITKDMIDDLRHRAVEVRAEADDVAGDQAKAFMVKIADEYEAIARRFEKRLDCPGQSCRGG